MINLFLIYFLICGLIMYFVIDNFVKDLNKYDYEIPEHKRENISELRKMINCTFGTTFNSLVPCLYLIGLFLGWLLIPVSIILSILEFFGIKVE